MLPACSASDPEPHAERNPEPNPAALLLSPARRPVVCEACQCPPPIPEENRKNSTGLQRVWMCHQ